jgi:hypothetical protein
MERLFCFEIIMLGYWIDGAELDEYENQHWGGEIEYTLQSWAHWNKQIVSIVNPQRRTCIHRPRMSVCPQTSPERTLKGGEQHRATHRFYASGVLEGVRRLLRWASAYQFRRSLWGRSREKKLIAPYVIFRNRTPQPVPGLIATFNLSFSAEWQIDRQGHQTVFGFNNQRFIHKQLDMYSVGNTLDKDPNFLMEICN